MAGFRIAKGEGIQPVAASAEPEEQNPIENIEPVSAADYKPVGTSSLIGEGQFLGFTPDQTGVLLLIGPPGTSDGGGCRGKSDQRIVVQDLDTGDRSPALPSDTNLGPGQLSFWFLDPEGGTGSVAFVVYCDDLEGDHVVGRTGTIGPDGTISDVQPIDVDDAGLPVGIEAYPSVDGATAMALTPDRSKGVFIGFDQRLWVTSLDGTERWDAPAGLVADAATFDPTGQVVAVMNEDQLLFWNYQTGELAEHSLPNQGAGTAVAEFRSDLVFNRAGTQLVYHSKLGWEHTKAVTSNDGTPPATNHG